MSEKITSQRTISKLSEADREEIRQKLEEVVGSEWVSDDPIFLASWGRDGQSRVDEPTYYTDFIVLPGSAEEISGIIKIANKYSLEIAVGAGGCNCFNNLMMHHGGIMIDVHRMNRILEIDDESMTATVEPAVAQSHLLIEARKLGLRCDNPGAPSSVSVIANFCNMAGEHEHNTRFNFGNTKLLAIELVIPTGEIIRTGNLAFPEMKPGVMGPDWDVTTLPVGSSGLAGIITKAVVKLFPYGEAKKYAKRIEFGLFGDLSDALDAMADLGIETYLASSIGEAGPEYFAACLPTAYIEDHERVLGYLTSSWTTAVWCEMEGTAEQVAYQQRRAREIFDKHDPDDTLNAVLDYLFNKPTMNKEAKQALFELLDVEVPEHWIPRLGEMFDVMELPSRGFAVGGHTLVGNYSAGVKGAKEAWTLFKDLMIREEYPGFEDGWWGSYGTVFRGSTAKGQELDVHFDRADKESCARRDDFLEKYKQEILDRGVQVFMQPAAYAYMGLPPVIVVGEKGADIWFKTRNLLDPNRVMHRNKAADENGIDL
jgi:FAD/FMN-containing dehydrogenase